MSDWIYVAAIPPILIWIAVSVYLARIDARLKSLERKVRAE